MKSYSRLSMNRRDFISRLVGAVVAAQLPVLPSWAKGIRYRGAHVAPLITQDNLFPLLETGANILRYSINLDSPAAVKKLPWLSGVQYSGDYLRLAVRDITHVNGMSVLLSLHNPPTKGQKDGDDIRSLTRAWNRLARLFRHDPAVTHYGLLNEPRMGSAECAEKMLQLYRAVRKVDQRKTILMQVPRAEAGAFNKAPILPGLKKVEYELHHYWPFNFTHQGVYTDTGLKYPSKKWNRKTMERHLLPARQFQLRSGYPIFVGEFGASMFCDQQSRTAWFQDSISLFEEWGWNWCYHAWRENPAWNAEIHPEVFEVLKNGWRKNL